MAAPVELEHSALQAFVVGGIHLFDGEAAPGLVFKDHLHRFGVALEHADIVDHIGGQVILGRGLFLHPVLAVDEAGKYGMAIRASGLGVGDVLLIGRSVRPQQGDLDDGPRQGLTGLGVLFHHNELGPLVVGDIQHLLFAPHNGDIIGVFGVHHITGRGGKLLHDKGTRRRQVNVNFAAAIGGFGPSLRTYIGVGVTDAEGCALQGNALVAGFVFVDFQGAGFGVVHKAHFYDVDRFVGCDSDSFRRAVVE